MHFNRSSQLKTTECSVLHWRAESREQALQGELQYSERALGSTIASLEDEREDDLNRERITRSAQYFEDVDLRKYNNIHAFFADGEPGSPTTYHRCDRLFPDKQEIIQFYSPGGRSLEGIHILDHMFSTRGLVITLGLLHKIDSSQEPISFADVHQFVARNSEGRVPQVKQRRTYLCAVNPDNTVSEPENTSDSIVSIIRLTCGNMILQETIFSSNKQGKRVATLSFQHGDDKLCYVAEGAQAIQ